MAEPEGFLFCDEDHWAAELYHWRSAEFNTRMTKEYFMKLDPNNSNNHESIAATQHRSDKGGSGAIDEGRGKSY